MQKSTENKNESVPFIIAIDGSNASGKGTIAKMISDYYGFDYLDTGLLYRAIAFRIVDGGFDINSLDDILFVAQKPISSKELRNPELKSGEIGNIASIIGVHKKLRTILDVYQRDFPKGKSGVVVDGRDIGTFIFPNADIKLFITASIKERAKRRFKELQSRGESVIYREVLADIAEREHRDSTRRVNPCVKADDAYLIDTSSFTPEEVMILATKHIDERLNETK